MRSYVVFSLLLAMVAALAFVLVVRPRRPQTLLQPVVVAVDHAPDASTPEPGDGGAFVAVTSGSDASSAHAVHAATRAADAGPEPRMDRPLRVIALGWELAAPGIVANNGAMPGASSVFTADGLAVHITATQDAAQVESALASGGADPHGADVAIVPLPAFVASYERLRALAPQVFFVVGWSHGREALGASVDNSLLSPPTRGDVRIAGAGGDSATFMSLFLLDQAGVPLERLALAPPDLRDRAPSASGSVPFIAVDREHTVDGSPDAPRRLLLTTADASRLVPFVAIAPAGFIASHAGALQAWARAWLAGMDRLRTDAPAVARAVANVDRAPDTLTLVRRLGLFEPSTLGDNARVAGLAGRGAVTLEALFQKAWQLWRSVGVLTTPAPDAAPLSTDTIAALVRADPSRARVVAAASTVAPVTTVVLVHRETGARVDDAALVAEIGLLAGVFERATLRVTVRNDPARTRAILADASTRFDLAAARLVPGTRVAGTGAVASVEVLAPR